MYVFVPKHHIGKYFKKCPCKNTERILCIRCLIVHWTVAIFYLLVNTKCIFYFGQQESCGNFYILFTWFIVFYYTCVCLHTQESCLSLGHLSRVLISYSVDTDTDVDVIQSVAGTFSRVLTQCRHRVSPGIKDLKNCTLLH